MNRDNILQFLGLLSGKLNFQIKEGEGASVFVYSNHNTDKIVSLDFTEKSMSMITESKSGREIVSFVDKPESYVVRAVLETLMSCDKRLSNKVTGLFTDLGYPKSVKSAIIYPIGITNEGALYSDKFGNMFLHQGEHPQLSLYVYSKMYATGSEHEFLLNSGLKKVVFDNAKHLKAELEYTLTDKTAMGEDEVLRSRVARKYNMISLTDAMDNGSAYKTFLFNELDDEDDTESEYIDRNDTLLFVPDAPGSYAGTIRRAKDLRSAEGDYDPSQDPEAFDKAMGALGRSIDKDNAESIYAGMVLYTDIEFSGERGLSREEWDELGNFASQAIKQLEDALGYKIRESTFDTTVQGGVVDVGMNVLPDKLVSVFNGIDNYFDVDGDIADKYKLEWKVEQVMQDGDDFGKDIEIDGETISSYEDLYMAIGTTQGTASVEDIVNKLLPKYIENAQVEVDNKLYSYRYLIEKSLYDFAMFTKITNSKKAYKYFEIYNALKSIGKAGTISQGDFKLPDFNLSYLQSMKVSTKNEYGKCTADVTMYHKGIDGKTVKSTVTKRFGVDLYNQLVGYGVVVDDVLKNEYSLVGVTGNAVIERVVSSMDTVLGLLGISSLRWDATATPVQAVDENEAVYLKYKSTGDSQGKVFLPTDSVQKAFSLMKQEFDVSGDAPLLDVVDVVNALVGRERADGVKLTKEDVEHAYASYYSGRMPGSSVWNIENSNRRGKNLRSADSSILVHWAREGAIDTIRDVVERGDVDINYQDSYGMTALDWAEREGHSDLVVYLESVGGKSGNSKVENSISYIKSTAQYDSKQQTWKAKVDIYSRIELEKSQFIRSFIFDIRDADFDKFISAFNIKSTLGNKQAFYQGGIDILSADTSVSKFIANYHATRIMSYLSKITNKLVSYNESKAIKSGKSSSFVMSFLADDIIQGAIMGDATLFSSRGVMQESVSLKDLVSNIDDLYTGGVLETDKVSVYSDNKRVNSRFLQMYKSGTFTGSGEEFLKDKATNYIVNSDDGKRIMIESAYKVGSKKFAIKSFNELEYIDRVMAGIPGFPEIEMILASRDTFSVKAPKKAISSKRKSLKSNESADYNGGTGDGVSWAENYFNNRVLSVNEDGEVLADTHLLDVGDLIDVEVGSKSDGYDEGFRYGVAEALARLLSVEELSESYGTFDVVESSKKSNRSKPKPNIRSKKVSQKSFFDKRKSVKSGMELSTRELVDALRAGEISGDLEGGSSWYIDNEAMGIDDLDDLPDLDDLLNAIADEFEGSESLEGSYGDYRWVIGLEVPSDFTFVDNSKKRKSVKSSGYVSADDLPEVKGNLADIVNRIRSGDFEGILDEGAYYQISVYPLDDDFNELSGAKLSGLSTQVRDAITDDLKANIDDFDGILYGGGDAIGYNWEFTYFNAENQAEWAAKIEKQDEQLRKEGYVFNRRRAIKNARKATKSSIGKATKSSQYTTKTPDVHKLVNELLDANAVQLDAYMDLLTAVVPYDVSKTDKSADEWVDYFNSVGYNIGSDGYQVGDSGTFELLFRLGLSSGVHNFKRKPTKSSIGFSKGDKVITPKGQAVVKSEYKNKMGIIYYNTTKGAFRSSLIKSAVSAGGDFSSKSAVEFLKNKYNLDDSKFQIKPNLDIIVMFDEDVVGDIAYSIREDLKQWGWRVIGDGSKGDDTYLVFTN
jgi:hypothetical protein